MEGKSILRIPVDSVQKPSDTRTIDAKTIDSLAESMLSRGQLQPILVRRTDDKFELVAGLRRLLAAEKLEFSDIDAIVVEADERDAELLSLIENLQREQLHYLDVAKALKRLVDEKGFSQDELSREIGMSQSCLANRIRLNRLPYRVRDRLLKSSLSERHARALLRLDGDGEQMRAIEHCESQKLSVRQFEGYIDRVKAESKPSNRFRVYLRDHRMLINAVLNTVKSLNAAGVRATSRVSELDDRIEVVVSLPLNAGKRPA